MNITVKTKDGKYEFRFSADSEGSWYEFDEQIAKDINYFGIGGMELQLHANGDVYGTLICGGTEVSEGVLRDKDGNGVSDAYSVDDGDEYTYIEDRKL